nr:ATP-grasp domain-containing protein [Gammaproteobacteria bacterium]
MLLIVGAHFYRSADYIRAARELGLGLSVGTDAAARWTHSDAVDVRAVDFTHFDGAVRDLTAFATDRGVTSVLGVDEVTVELAAGVAAELGVKSNPLSALRRTHRKDAFRDALRGCEYSVSSFRAFGLNESVLPTELFDQYPCVAKPTAMSASRGVIRVDEASALGPVLERLRALVARERSYFEQRILVEPFVDGPEFALEGMLTTGRLNVLALFDKPDVSEGPYFAESIYVTPSQLPHVRQRACAACVEAAAAKLGLVDGPVHAELRWSKQGPVLLEMAARGIGGLCGRIFSMARPYSLEEVHIRQAVGLPPPTLPSEVPAAGVLML